MPPSSPQPQNYSLSAFGRRMRDERKRKSLLLKEFASLVEVSEKSQIAYENGKTPPTVSYLYRASEQGIDIEYVLTGKRSDRPENEDDARFLARFHQLGDRERHAVMQLVENLNAGAPEPGSIAAMVDPDQLALARGATVQESRPFRAHLPLPALRRTILALAKRLIVLPLPSPPAHPVNTSDTGPLSRLCAMKARELWMKPCLLACPPAMRRKYSWPHSGPKRRVKMTG